MADMVRLALLKPPEVLAQTNAAPQGHPSRFFATTNVNAKISFSREELEGCKLAGVRCNLA